MSLLVFLVEATLISLSGILAPGPITAMAVGKGGKSPHAGAFVAMGHGIVEVPLMVAVFYGVGRLMALSYVQAGIGLLGGLLLLVMRVEMLRSIRQAEVGSGQDTRSHIVAGMLLSIGNPYFLVWWATVGAALIMRSFRFGVFGFLAFGALHWLCDLAWNYFLSVLSFKGGAFFGRRFQQVVFAFCGVFLVFSSARLLAEAARVVVG